MDLFEVSAAKMGVGVIHRNKIMSLVLYIWFVFFVVADFQIFFLAVLISLILLLVVVVVVVVVVLLL